jgi:hypothetical protein
MDIYHIIDFIIYNGTLTSVSIYFLLFVYFIMLNDGDKTELPNIEENKESKEVKIEQVAPKYEDKYIEKFKKFPNEFSFTEFEKNKMSMYAKKMYDDANEIRTKNIREQQRYIDIIDKIIILNKDANVNELKKNLIKEFASKFWEDYDSDDDEYNTTDKLYENIVAQRGFVSSELKRFEEQTIKEEDFQKEAREKVINEKLDGCIHNYVMELTPLGNVYMRYNNDKKSFEYFCNNTLPYRYLESIGRKYVTTYWCKPIFVDIDEELKKAETRDPPKPVVVKKYTKEFAKQPMKNRNISDLTIPSNSIAKIQQNSQTKLLIKENANRYTWEGRLSNFCPIQKISKKIFDKNSSLSYAEYKKMQNKK